MSGIHIPTDLEQSPEKHEISAATILAHHFDADVFFIPKSARKTADFTINGVAWELKSPTGKGKRNVQRTLQAALTQSENIVFDARRSKIHQNKIVNELQFQYSKINKLKRLILITKTGKIIDFTV